MKTMKRQLVPMFVSCLVLRLDASSPCASPIVRQKPATIHIQRTIIVNKADNLLKLFVTGQPCRYWKVATGKYHCTPEGTFRIIEKSYISRSGDSPLGTRWLGLNTLGRRHLMRVGIHGTNDPKSIGHWASLACIRMHNEDVNYLYDLVPVGTTVKVVNISPDKPATFMRPRLVTKEGIAATPISFHR